MMLFNKQKYYVLYVVSASNMEIGDGIWYVVT